MDAKREQFTTSLTLAEVEALIHRAVKEAVHEEITLVLAALANSEIDGEQAQGEGKPARNVRGVAEAQVEDDRYRVQAKSENIPQGIEIGVDIVPQSSAEQVFYGALIAAGLIKEAKRATETNLLEPPLVQVHGAPVSETIIAERR